MKKKLNLKKKKQTDIVGHRGSLLQKRALLKHVVASPSVKHIFRSGAPSYNETLSVFYLSVFLSVYIYFCLSTPIYLFGMRCYYSQSTMDDIVFILIILIEHQTILMKTNLLIFNGDILKISSF